MRPPEKAKGEYEKVKAGELIPGIISEIKYDMAHKSVWQGKEKIRPAVQIKLKLDGYKYAHGTPWLTFSYGEKARLYLTFIAKLVENARPDMDFDLDCLKGMRVKTIWSDNGDYQNLDNIYPLEYKVNPGVPSTAPHEEEPEPPVDEDIPF